MIDPYKMIVVNVILCLILIAGVLFYKFVYPKKNLNLFVLLILVGLMPLFSMLRTGTYESGDLSLHAIRSMSFYKILFTEHILPRWTPEFYSGYGDPYFSFAYFLPYLITSIIHFFGISFISSIKLMLAGAFLISGVGMYAFVKEDLGNKAAFTAGIFYMFAPFHLINMHFQVTIAMALSYIFLPITLYLSRKILLNIKLKWIILLSLSIMLFIMSHQAISLSFIPIIFLYGLFLKIQHKIKLKNLLLLVSSILFGFLLSAFYWLPIIIESQFVQQTFLTKDSLLFASLPQLIYSPWRYGFLFQGHKGELAFIIGYTQLFAVMLGIYILFRKKVKKSEEMYLIFFLIIFFILLFFMLPISKPIWYSFSFLESFQYTSRLLIAVSACTAIIAGLVVRVFNKNWFTILFCSITILYTILNWGNRATISTINDDVLAKENKIWPTLKVGKTGLEPSSPIWANSNKNLYNKKRLSDVEVLSGEAIVKSVLRTSEVHNYLIAVESDSARIKENTLFFPGWTLKVNNKYEQINYKTAENTGVITFDLEKGKHEVILKFEKTEIRKTADLISLTGGFTLLLLILINSFTYLKQYRYFQHQD